MKRDGLQIGCFYIEVDTPYVIYTTRIEVDHNLMGVTQENVQLCLKFPGNCTYYVDCAKQEKVRHPWVFPV